MMYTAITNNVNKHRVIILIVAVVFAVSSLALAGRVVGHLSTQGFDDPSSSSVKAEKILRNRFKTMEPNVILLLSSTDSHTSIDSKVVTKRAQTVFDDIARLPNFRDLYSYWSVTSPTSKNAFRNCDEGTKICSGLAFAAIDSPSTDVDTQIRSILNNNQNPNISIAFTGRAALEPEFTKTITEDLTRAATIAFPIALLVLLVIFRSVVAAILPLFSGAIVIGGTLLALFLISSFTTVSASVLNLVIVLGIGLSVNFSLLLVSRFRRELAVGNEVFSSVKETIRREGRTVIISGLLVGFSLSALLLCPQPFLRSFAFGGLIVSLLAVLSSVIVIPACLFVVGRRIDAMALPSAGGWIERTWSKQSQVVMRFALPFAVIAMVLLAALSVPAKSLHVGVADQRALPEKSTGRSTMASFGQFQAGQQMAVDVVMEAVPSTADIKSAVTNYKNALYENLSVQALVTPFLTYLPGGATEQGDKKALLTNPDGTKSLRIQVVGLGDPLGSDAEEFVKYVRSVPPPFPAETGGTSAKLVDNKASLGARIPLIIGVVLLMSYVALLLIFGSVLLPIKTLLLNVLTMSALTGLLVLVFQQGRWGTDELLGFTAYGVIDYGFLVAALAVVFGFILDYEVISLSRIRESYEAKGDNTTAVVEGLAHTARIATASAIVVTAVLIVFASSSVSFIKMFGVAIAVAVILEATVVRAVLAPALFKPFGSANWSAPARIRAISGRFGWQVQVTADK